MFVIKSLLGRKLLDLFHVAVEGLEVSEFSILFLGAADVEEQLPDLTPDVRSLVSHHVFAKNEVPLLKWFRNNFKIKTWRLLNKTCQRKIQKKLYMIKISIHASFLSNKIKTFKRRRPIKESNLNLIKIGRPDITVGFRNLFALVRNPERHLGQQLRVGLEDVVSVRLDVLLQEERTHVRRRLERLSLQEVPADLDARLLHLLALPIVEQVVEQVERVASGAGLEKSRGRGTSREIRAARF